MDAIYLVLDGEQKGPFTLAQVRESLSKGDVSGETLAWYDGLPDWASLDHILEKAPASSTSGFPPRVTMASLSGKPEEFSKEQLMNICRKQNLLMWSLLAGIVSAVIAKITVIGLPLILCTIAFRIYSLYSLGNALRMSLVWLYCIGLFIPLIAIIILLVVSGRASKVLEEGGISIGLMGGRMKDFEN